MIGSNSLTEAMSSSLSITSPSMGARDNRTLSTSNSLSVSGAAVLPKISQLQRGAGAGARRTAAGRVTENQRLCWSRAGERGCPVMRFIIIYQQCYKKKMTRQRV